MYRLGRPRLSNSNFTKIKVEKKQFECRLNIETQLKPCIMGVQGAPPLAARRVGAPGGPPEASLELPPVPEKKLEMLPLSWYYYSVFVD